MSDTVETKIINVLDTEEEVNGTEALALLTGVHNRKWLRMCACKLQELGAIIINASRGGRGHPTVYKRNRNQPGQPRKR